MSWTEGVEKQRKERQIWKKSNIDGARDRGREKNEARKYGRHRVVTEEEEGEDGERKGGGVGNFQKKQGGDVAE